MFAHFKDFSVPGIMDEDVANAMHTGRVFDLMAAFGVN